MSSEVDNSNESTSSTTAPEAVTKKGLSKIARVLLVVLALVVVAGVATAAYFGLMYREVARNIAPPKAERAAIERELEPAPAPVVEEEKKEPTYLLLLGNDRRPGYGWARSDTIMIARMEEGETTVSVLSLARDLRVKVPGHGTTKLAHAAAYGGPALTIKTVKKLTGLPIHHYVMLDFEGFAAVVDAVGGVKMTVDRASTSPEGVYVPAGKHRLNGQQALAYVRNRHGYAAGDHQRVKNQQKFLLVLAKQASKEENFSRLPEIIRSVSNNMQTDMSVSELVDLAGQLRGIKKSQLRAKSAPVKGAMIGGGSYQLLKESAFQEMLADFEDGGFVPKPPIPKTQIPK